ncbi:hypothetical protein A4E84_36965 [Streptomyces qaidamensis]|uniref:SPW repeat-containing integral membrane domain-containing protein n=2 Tax=Streptomyces qaidamensis TaxID=1783515 RepID=A0A143CE38_9ACTN|nr:hypothetical protein A4E84_36965 [Streptomyces qaidamensis]
MELQARYVEASTKPAAQATEGLSLLTGLYLAISPWAVGFYDAPALTVSNLISGLALAVLSLGFGSAYERTHGLSWVAAAIGVWTIVAPWAVSDAPDSVGPVVTNVITGGVACLLGLVTISLARMQRK